MALVFCSFAVKTARYERTVMQNRANHVLLFYIYIYNWFVNKTKTGNKYICLIAKFLQKHSTEKKVEKQSLRARTYTHTHTLSKYSLLPFSIQTFGFNLIQSCRLNLVP